MLPMKNNLGNDSSGLAFELSQRHGREGQPCVLWESGAVDTTADSALAPAAAPRGPKPEGRDHAGEFLRDALADGPRLAKEVTEDAREGHGIAKRTLDRARSELGVIAYREAVPGSWWWKLSSKDATNNATDP